MRSFHSRLRLFALNYRAKMLSVEIFYFVQIRAQMSANQQMSAMSASDWRATKNERKRAQMTAN